MLHRPQLLGLGASCCNTVVLVPKDFEQSCLLFLGRHGQYKTPQNTQRELGLRTSERQTLNLTNNDGRTQELTQQSGKDTAGPRPHDGHA